MMKKRIAILSLVFLFLVSTTGLPVTYHLCEMMGEKSLDECEMCAVEVEKVESSCCSEEDSDNLIQLSTLETTCCFESFELNKIEDDFSLSVNTILILSNVVIATIDQDNISLTEDKLFTQQTSYNLPPPKFGRKLLQTIHQLKIDVSFC
jgi:hypothetical protein